MLHNYILRAFIVCTYGRNYSNLKIDVLGKLFISCVTPAHLCSLETGVGGVRIEKQRK